VTKSTWCSLHFFLVADLQFWLYIIFIEDPILSMFIEDVFHSVYVHMNKLKSNEVYF
jgi:hypothetical protein